MCFLFFWEERGIIFRGGKIYYYLTTFDMLSTRMQDEWNLSVSVSDQHFLFCSPPGFLTKVPSISHQCPRTMALQTLNRSNKLNATRISTQLQDNAQQPLLRIWKIFEMGKDKDVWLLAYIPNYSSKILFKSRYISIQVSSQKRERMI